MLIIRILSFNLFFVEGYLPICFEKNMKIDIGYQRESIKLNFASGDDINTTVIYKIE